MSSADTATHPTVDVRVYDAGLLLLRLGIGLLMAAHGAQHLFGWFGGLGLDGTAAYFTSSGYPMGGVMAVVAGVSELLGGLGLALGLLTPLSAAAILGTMINAVAVSWEGEVLNPSGVEHELLLALGAAALALTGPGRIAADRFLPGVRLHRIEYGLAAVVLGALTALAVLLVRN